MRNLFFIALLLISNWAKAQINAQLVDKTFTVKTGTICVETTTPDPCAGYNTYFEITFKRENATILEKGISSCDKLIYSNLYTIAWEFEKPNKIILKNVEPNYDDGKKIFVDNTLIFENNKLTAKPENKFWKEYIFERLPNKNQNEISKLKELFDNHELKGIGRVNECGDRIGKWKFYYQAGKLYAKGSFGLSGEWLGRWKFYYKPEFD